MIRKLLAAAAAAAISSSVLATTPAPQAPDASEGAVQNHGTSQSAPAYDWNAWTKAWTQGFSAEGWQDGAGHVQPGTTMTFNPAHPAGWAQWVDPKSHSKMHMAFTNPATYAQFMQPQFYMQFANPNNWMAWMNPAAYGKFMEPATWAYWMQPGAYMHGMNPASYMQMMDPNAYGAFMNPNVYMQWMNPAAYAMPTGASTAAGTATMPNYFDPNAWMSMFTPPGTPATTTTQ